MNRKLIRPDFNEIKEKAGRAPKAAQPEAAIQAAPAVPEAGSATLRAGRGGRSHLRSRPTPRASTT